MKNSPLYFLEFGRKLGKDIELTCPNLEMLEGKMPEAMLSSTEARVEAAMERERERERAEGGECVMAAGETSRAWESRKHRGGQEVPEGDNIHTRVLRTSRGMERQEGQRARCR